MIYTNKLYALIFALTFLAWVASELLGPARWQGSPGRGGEDQQGTALKPKTK